MENGLNLKDRNQILQIQSGLKKNGLAFVDSSSVTGKPDRFTSIPEAWSFGSTVMINQRRYDKYGSSQKSDAIAILKEKRQQPLEQLRHIGNRQCLSITPKQYQGSLLSCLFYSLFLHLQKKFCKKNQQVYICLWRVYPVGSPPFLCRTGYPRSNSKGSLKRIRKN